MGDTSPLQKRNSASLCVASIFPTFTTNYWLFIHISRHSSSILLTVTPATVVNSFRPIVQKTAHPLTRRASHTCLAVYMPQLPPFSLVNHLSPPHYHGHSNFTKRNPSAEDGRIQRTFWGSPTPTCGECRWVVQEVQEIQDRQQKTRLFPAHRGSRGEATRATRATPRARGLQSWSRPRDPRLPEESQEHVQPQSHH